MLWRGRAERIERAGVIAAVDGPVAVVVFFVITHLGRAVVAGA